MNSFLHLFSFPYIQRALVAGLFVGILLAILGIFVSLKKMSFFSEGVAHASLTGIAIGLLFGGNPFFSAIIFSVIFASILYLLERKNIFSTDSLIGILFPTSLAIGVILIHFKKGYQPDLLSFLFGNILTIRTHELWIICVLTILIILFLVSRYKNCLLVSLNKELAKISGISVEWYSFLLYILIAVATVISIKILGIVLVTALLTIPISTAKLISSSTKKLLLYSITFSELSVVGGTVISLFFDLPTSSVIILVCGVFFAFIFLLSYLQQNFSKKHNKS